MKIYGNKKCKWKNFEKIYKKMKKCVDKYWRVIYNKINKTKEREQIPDKIQVKEVQSKVQLM